MNFTYIAMLAVLSIAFVGFLITLFKYGEPKVIIFDPVNPKGRRVSLNELETVTLWELHEQLKVLEERKIFIIASGNRDSKHRQALAEIEKSYSVITNIIHEPKTAG